MFAMTFLSGLGVAGLGLLVLVLAFGFACQMVALAHKHFFLYLLVSDDLIAGFMTLLSGILEVMGALAAEA